MDFQALAVDCAPDIHPITLTQLVKVESAFNPFAIGVVKGRLERQPTNLDEAVATVKNLESLGYNYSLGIAQINKFNLGKYNLSLLSAFQPCANLKAGAEILKGCYQAAQKNFLNDQTALDAALSCYYSGNFTTGLKPDFVGQPSYVEKIRSIQPASLSVIKVIPVKPTGKKAPRSLKTSLLTQPAANQGDTTRDIADSALLF